MGLTVLLVEMVDGLRVSGEGGWEASVISPERLRGGMRMEGGKSEGCGALAFFVRGC
jgi:hypothetical protein